MTYNIRSLTSHGTGAEITGLDLTKSVSEPLKKQLEDDFAKFHVLVIRNQTFSSTDQFLRSAEAFGEHMPHHRKSGNSVENSAVFDVKNVEVSPGKYYIVGESFHTDHSNDPVPPKATTLYPVSLPKHGGDTQFVNVHAAYDELNSEVKKRIDGLLAVHVYISKYSPRELTKLDEESLKHLPAPTLHPLVRIHPENGRKFLYLNPVRMESIVGMSDEASQKLIGELMGHATQKKYEYRHKWTHGDMVIWDNRSVMHQANADYDMVESRHLWRVMIKGRLHQTDIDARRGINIDVSQRVPSRAAVTISVK